MTTDETLLGGGGEPAKEAGPSFRDQLPEEYRDHAVLSKFENVGELAKSWAEAQKMVGQKGAFPKGSQEEAPDEWNEFYNKAGRPETPEGYGIQGEGDIAALLGDLHKAGLNKHQAKQVYAALEAMGKSKQEAALEAERASRDSSYREIVKLYGSEEAAKEALSKATGFIEEKFKDQNPAFVDLLRNGTVKIGDQEVPLGNVPVIAQAFQQLSDMFGDDKRNLKGEAAPSQADDMARYQQLVTQLSQTQKYTKEHDELMGEYNKVYARLFPKIQD